jgi:hypothetical protein
MSGAELQGVEAHNFRAIMGEALQPRDENVPHVHPRSLESSKAPATLQEASLTRAERLGARPGCSASSGREVDAQVGGGGLQRARVPAEGHLELVEQAVRGGEEDRLVLGHRAVKVRGDRLPEVCSTFCKPSDDLVFVVWGCLPPKIVDEDGEPDVGVLDLPKPQRRQGINLHKGGRKRTPRSDAAPGELAVERELAQPDETPRGVHVQRDGEDHLVEVEGRRALPQFISADMFIITAKVP